MTRRSLLSLFGASLRAVPRWPSPMVRRIVDYIARHRRSEGGYGWISDVTAQVTPTFGAVGSLVLIEQDVPEAGAVARFVRETYPVPERRRTERPLWRLDWEQVQTLLWLGQPIDDFRTLAQGWTQPAEFTPAYEMGGNPVFQHQAMAVRVRQLLKLPPTDAWRSYFQARRRADGTYNTTPASDASGGHVMNTLWGIFAADALGLEGESKGLEEWVLACRGSGGGFRYSPSASIGDVEDIAYTWCALQILAKLSVRLPEPRRTAEWIESLATPDGGFQDRSGGEPNPLATCYALGSLRLLDWSPAEAPALRAARSRREPLPRNGEVFQIQIEAPGAGSPRDAVAQARAFGIHLWTAKNAAPGWLDDARKVAAEEGVPVEFHHGDEEYGTFTMIPGLGCYSHLVDLVAPFGRDWGTPMPKKNHPYPWSEFRDIRMAALRRGGGRMIWQFLESEELTRVLLDEACEKGTYSSIAAFHFGNENFLHSQPFLHRWYERLPFVSLQDAHGKESWWWSTMLRGFTTLFIASEPTWSGWLEALEKRHVVSVRHDAVTQWRTHWAGGSDEVRGFVRTREKSWRWWDEKGQVAKRPAGSLVVLRPGMRFEAGTPSEGQAVRLRLSAENNGQGLPQADNVELVDLRIDGKRVETEFRKTREDRYHIVQMQSAPGRHTAEAEVRWIAAGRIETIRRSWEWA